MSGHSLHRTRWCVCASPTSSLYYLHVAHDGALSCDPFLCLWHKHFERLCPFRLTATTTFLLYHFFLFVCFAISEPVTRTASDPCCLIYGFLSPTAVFLPFFFFLNIPNEKNLFHTFVFEPFSQVLSQPSKDSKELSFAHNLLATM